MTDPIIQKEFEDYVLINFKKYNSMNNEFVTCCNKIPLDIATPEEKKQLDNILRKCMKKINKIRREKLK